jgi:hypothetical protein
MDEKIKLTVTCKSFLTLPIDELTELQGNLAEMSKENYEKLKKAFQKYGITFALTVWKNEGKNLIIDGTGRFRTLMKMKKEGFVIPPLPVVETFCKDMAEAKRKILLGRSEFHKTTEEGLYEFLALAEIDFEEVKNETDIPGIDVKKFDLNFNKEMTNISTEYHLMFKTTKEEAEVIQCALHSLADKKNNGKIDSRWRERMLTLMAEKTINENKKNNKR